MLPREREKRERQERGEEREKVGGGGRLGGGWEGFLGFRDEGCREKEEKGERERGERDGGGGRLWDGWGRICRGGSHNFIQKIILFFIFTI